MASASRSRSGTLPPVQGQGRASEPVLVSGWKRLASLALSFLFLVPTAHGALVSSLDLPAMMSLQSMYIKSLPELSTWNATQDCSTWQRVGCDSNRISALYFLDVGLGGVFPYIVTTLTKLRILYLRNNAFTGSFPEGLSKLLSLQALRIDGNQLVGTMPNSFSVLKSLYKFHVSSNLNLTGNFPASWKNFNLQEFYVENNKFTGPIPSVICDWPGLQRLHIGGVAWSGSIPSCMSKNTQLIDMYMDNCGTITGTFPDLNIKSLQRIFVNGNYITGPIPPSIGNLTNLNVLFASGNLLTGPLPDTMGKLTALTAWVMEFNTINGTIPQSIGNMTVVQRILLDNNKLTGTIPATLGNLKKLTILLLEGNSLTGRIPPQIPAGCPVLNQFNVESNKLTGIPPGGFASTNLYQVNYRSNLFSGNPNFAYSTGTKFCPPYWPNSWIHSSVAFNCFQKINSTGCKDNDAELLKNQYSKAACASFCGADSPTGACNGFGYCGLNATCICDPGYVSANNNTTCVPINSAASPPPPNKLSASPPPNIFSASPPPNKLSASPPPSALTSSPPPNTVTTSPPPNTLTSSPPPNIFSSSPPPNIFSSSPPPSTVTTSPPPIIPSSSPPPNTVIAPAPFSTLSPPSPPPRATAPSPSPPNSLAQMTIASISSKAALKASNMGSNLFLQELPADSVCSVGGSAASCSALQCTNSVGYGCSCAQGVSLNTPYCKYIAMCMDLEACPVRSLCSEVGGQVSCSCSSGYRPIKARALDSFFAYCARTKCSNEESFVGFQCSSL